jgi:hypothetical protein
MMAYLNPRSSASPFAVGLHHPCIVSNNVSFNENPKRNTK